MGYAGPRLNGIKKEEGCIEWKQGEAGVESI